jgi:hypothetical protein
MAAFLFLLSLYDGCAACLSVDTSGVLPTSLGVLTLVFLIAVPSTFALWLLKRRSVSGRVWLARWLTATTAFGLTAMAVVAVAYNATLNARRRAGTDELSKCEELARVAPTLDELSKHRAALAALEQRADRDAPAVRAIRDAYAANADRVCEEQLANLRAYAARWGLTEEDAAKRLGWSEDAGSR